MFKIKLGDLISRDFFFFTTIDFLGSRLNTFGVEINYNHCIIDIGWVCAPWCPTRCWVCRLSPIQTEKGKHSRFVDLFLYNSQMFYGYSKKRNYSNFVLQIDLRKFHSFQDSSFSRISLSIKTNYYLLVIFFCQKYKQ